MKLVLVLGLFVLINWFGVSSAVLAAEKRLIAVIIANSNQRFQDIHTAFANNSELFCGDDCKIYVQTPNADVMSLRNSVRKAVALAADLIVTYGPSAALAAKAESPPMPTLFADVYDPVQLGLVPSKGKKKSNMTGIRGDAPVQALLKYFVEATKSQKLVVLYDTQSPEGSFQKAALEAACKMRGVAMVPLAIESSEDHLTLLKSIPADADGLFLASSEHSDDHLNTILSFASSRKLPVITQRAGLGEAGAFMVLETSDAEQGEQLAVMAEKVFSGKKIADIPLYTPRRVGFIVNLKVAKECDIQVPFQVLSVATRIVR